MAYTDRVESSLGNQSGFTPKSRVELSVSCSNLKDKDVFSKSDPMCVLFNKPYKSNTFIEIDRTEVVKNCLNPVFKHKFVIDYFFEQVQELRFDLYDSDSDSKTAKLKDHDNLGQVTCKLSEIVTRGNFQSKLINHGKKISGIVKISAQEVSSSSDKVTLEFQADNLDKKDFFGKSDPYMVISRQNNDQTFTKVHTTEVIKNTLHPKWRPFILPVQLLSIKGDEGALKFDIYDWDSNSDPDFIGTFNTTLKALKSGVGQQNTFEVINPKKRSEKKYKNSGSAKLTQFKYHEEFSFLEYIQAGLQMNLTVAIDFTQSNGDPRDSSSLHFYNERQHSQYALAINAVGKILEDYDQDKMFPALGFGALLENKQPSHCFFLNRHPSNPFCTGIEGVVKTYYDCLAQVKLYGPTNFEPCIIHAAQMAASAPQNNYSVLLIITDGVITDMIQTKAAIIEASHLPISIVIVGVGCADFSLMNELDSDKGPLTWNYKSAVRDIVQFVPFQKIIDKYSQDPFASSAELAKCVLEEIPNQVTTFMKMRSIKPNTLASLNNRSISGDGGGAGQKFMPAQQSQQSKNFSSQQGEISGQNFDNNLPQQGNPNSMPSNQTNYPVFNPNQHGQPNLSGTTNQTQTPPGQPPYGQNFSHRQTGQPYPSHGFSNQSSYHGPPQHTNVGYPTSSSSIPVPGGQQPQQMPYSAPGSMPYPQQTNYSGFPGQGNYQQTQGKSQFPPYPNY